MSDRTDVRQAFRLFVPAGRGLPAVPNTDRLTHNALGYRDIPIRRGGRVAEGGGLLNRYTLKRRIKGSNPFLSATIAVCRRLFAGLA